MYAERRGTFTNLEGRVSHLGSVVTAPGVAWPDWMIASELAVRLGGDLGFASVEEIWDEIARVSPLHAGVDQGLYGRDGIVVPVPEGGPPYSPPRPLDPMADPGIASAELHAVPPTALAAAAPARDNGAAHTDPADEGIEEAHDAPAAVSPGEKPPMLAGAPSTATTGQPLPVAPAGGMRLVVRRTLWDAGTQVAHAAHLAALAAPAAAAVHPDELAALGVAPGTPVTVSSLRGRLTLPVVADAGVPAGCVAVPFNVPGHPVSALVDAEDPVVTVRLEVAVGAGGAA
jgi:anaerobic selenocysteine-containing dehydrogenase